MYIWLTVNNNAFYSSIHHYIFIWCKIYIYSSFSPLFHDKQHSIVYLKKGIQSIKSSSKESKVLDKMIRLIGFVKNLVLFNKRIFSAYKDRTASIICQHQHHHGFFKKIEYIFFSSYNQYPFHLTLPLTRVQISLLTHIPKPVQIEVQQVCFYLSAAQQQHECFDYKVMARSFFLFL